jgi:hypothetical protein
MPNTFELIASVAVGSGGAANIEFTSIPSTYTDLVLNLTGRFSSGSGFSVIELNGSAANFSNRILEGNGSSASSFVSGNTNYAGALDGSGDTANTFSSAQYYIPNYAGSTNKSISFEAVNETNGTTAYIDLGALLWSQTAAINAIRLKTHTGANYAQYSTAYLYGVKNA